MVGFYRFAVIDGYIADSPAQHIRRPKIDTESTTLGLDRMELDAFLAQAAVGGPVDHALACLLGLLGLRVSEACSINIEHLSSERGHRTVRIVGKGARSPSSRCHRGWPGRSTWPPANAHPARSCSADPGSDSIATVHPHRAAGRQEGRDLQANLAPLLRHSFITAALDAGVPLRDVRIAARHADPRTTTRYDRARHNLDRHASCVVSAFIAGGG